MAQTNIIKNSQEPASEDPSSRSASHHTDNPTSATTTANENENMVAGPGFFSVATTPPSSPHRNSYPFSNANGHLMKASPLKQNHQQSPLNPHCERSPTRKSMSAVSPTPSKGGVSTTGNENSSPLPPSSRAQPATATAPVVGRHKKTGSLVGFDPLLVVDNTANSSSNSPKEPATPTGSNHKEAVPASLSNLTLSPPTPPKEGTNNNNNSKEQATANSISNLEGELRKLATEVIAQSPQSKEPKSKIRKPKFGRGSSLTPKFTLTPPLQFNRSSSVAQMDTRKEPASAPTRKMPWQRHRRGNSLEGPAYAPATSKGQDQSLTQATSLEVPEPPMMGASLVGPASSLENNNNNDNMMKDWYDVVKTTQDALSLPSLARPAPTSFLTGKEVVRSSELDPSPFQLELPSLDQVVVNGRVTQFVEQYRKEDMNFDLNMSLVGKRRMELQSFYSLDKIPMNSHLTMAHKPLVESLLEAADDVTIAAFVESSNAQSSDTRREVVIFERQMQFIVVFRGTTAEQQGKTPLFKKNKAVPLETLDPSEDKDCKVYAGMKESYLDLERRVFAALDNLMDQNPFCGVVFSGQSFGGAMATLGAYRYALNRPVVRVTCQTFGSPKVGNRSFRQYANSLPNLKVMRVEYASDTKCFVPADGAHVGHSIVLGKDSQSNAVTAVAYKFDDDHDGRKHHHTHKPIFSAWKKERDITSYVGSLEEMHQSKRKWVTDFAGEDGTGVRGEDNEQRQVV